MSTTPTDEQTVFHATLTDLTARGVRCKSVTDVSGTYGSYFFADDSYLTWGAFSATGAENALHPISDHGHFEAFHGHKHGEASRDFNTGDYATDSAALIDWITALADRHGRASQ